MVRVLPDRRATVGLKGEALAEMGDMLAEGAVAFSDDGKGVQDTGMMRLVMDYAKQFDAVVIAHCEDESLVGKGVVNEGVVSTRLGLAGWPAAAEEIMVARDIRLAELTGLPPARRAPLDRGHASSSCARPRRAGVRVTAEVTPHHLFLDEDALDVDYDTNLKMNPPLRTRRGPRGARRRAARRHRSTASPPTTRRTPPHEKALEFELAPFGTTGLETALPLVITQPRGQGACSTGPTWCDWMAIGPRAALGLPEVRSARPVRRRHHRHRPRGARRGHARVLREQVGQLGVPWGYTTRQGDRGARGRAVALRNGKVVDVSGTRSERFSRSRTAPSSQGWSCGAAGEADGRAVLQHVDVRLPGGPHRPVATPARS